MKLESVMGNIKHGKVARITGSAAELHQVAGEIRGCRYCFGHGELFVWQQPRVRYVSKSRLPFISSK